MHFTQEMSRFLVELVQQNEADLFPNSKQKGARKTIADAWKTVYDDFIDEYPTSGITLEQCKNKWKNQKAEAKKDNAIQKRERNATGGGSQPSILASSSSQMIQEMFSSRPAFDGIPNARETPLFKGKPSVEPPGQETTSFFPMEVLIENKIRPSENVEEAGSVMSQKQELTSKTKKAAEKSTSPLKRAAQAPLVGELSESKTHAQIDFEQVELVEHQGEEPVSKKKKADKRTTPTPKRLTQAHCLELQMEVLEMEREKIKLESKFYQKGLSVFEKLENFLAKQ